MASGTSSARRSRRTRMNSLLGDVGGVEGARDVGVERPDARSSSSWVLGTLPGLHQVRVEAGQPLVPAELGADHLGADAALADQQPLVDQLLDRLPGGRSGQAESGGQRQLVLQSVARSRAPRC